MCGNCGEVATTFTIGADNPLEYRLPTARTRASSAVSHPTGLEQEEATSPTKPERRPLYWRALTHLQLQPLLPGGRVRLLPRHLFPLSQHAHLLLQALDTRLSESAAANVEQSMNGHNWVSESVCCLPRENGGKVGSRNPTFGASAAL